MAAIRFRGVANVALWAVAGILFVLIVLDRTEGAKADPVTMLPPMLVREHRGGPVWRYASVANLEVLSRCDDQSTSAFIHAFLQRQLELEQLLPPSLQVQQSTPLSLILMTPAMEKTMSEELVRQMEAAAKEQSSGYITPRESSWQIYHLARSIPQIVLSDTDSTGMIYTLDATRNGAAEGEAQIPAFFKGIKSGGAYGDMTFTASRIGSILGARLPPLPSWFKTGFLALAQKINWTDSSTIEAGPVFWVSNRLNRRVRWNWTMPNGMINPQGLVGESTPGQFGTSYGHQRSEDAPLKFLPMESLWAGPPYAGTAEDAALWDSQISLFFHWALSEKNRRQAFWRFVDLSSRQGTTTSLVKQCFGIDPSRLQMELALYMPVAVKNPLVLVQVHSVLVPSFRLRDASETEVARLKGAMGRKEIAYVRDSSPETVEPYVRQVEAILREPYDAGARDPGLLAVLGLFDFDLGKMEAARPLLEAAAAAHVARPSLYVALAKIRSARALADPQGAEGKLSAGQVDSILGPLREGRLYAPAQFEAYALAVSVWDRAGQPPAAQDLSLVDEGVELFPENTSLVLASATLEAQCGLRQRAILLLDRGRAHVSAASIAATKLGDLRAQLASP